MLGKYSLMICCQILWIFANQDREKLNIWDTSNDLPIQFVVLPKHMQEQMSNRRDSNSHYKDIDCFVRSPLGRVRTQDEQFFSPRSKRYIWQPISYFTLAKLPFQFDKYEQLKACVAALCKVKWRNMLISSRSCNLLRVSFWSTTRQRNYIFYEFDNGRQHLLIHQKKKGVWQLQCSPFHAIKISNCTGGERIKLLIGQFNCRRYSQILFQRNRVAVLLLPLLLPIN